MPDEEGLAWGCVWPLMGSGWLGGAASSDKRAHTWIAVHSCSASWAVWQLHPPSSRPHRPLKQLLSRRHCHQCLRLTPSRCRQVKRKWIWRRWRQTGASTGTVVGLTGGAIAGLTGEATGERIGGAIGEVTTPGLTIPERITAGLIVGMHGGSPGESTGGPIAAGTRRGTHPPRSAPVWARGMEEIRGTSSRVFARCGSCREELQPLP